MQMVLLIVFLLLSIGFFVLSYTQFQEKGFLWNNAYLLASHRERQKMDGCKECKHPHYRQSGFVFLFLGIAFLLIAGYFAVHWNWLLIAFALCILTTVIYAFVSSIKSELHS